MRRSELVPTAHNHVVTLVFCIALLSTALFSTGIHEGGDNVYSMLTCTALVLAMSQVAYVGLTFTQYAFALLMRRARARSKQHWGASAMADERNDNPPSTKLHSYLSSTYTISEVLCNTLDFGNRRSEIRLWISRQHLWYTLYVFPVGVYGAFVCTPVYDPVCSICFALGLFVAAVRVEAQRGSAWGRTTARRVMLAVATCTGLSAFCLVFVLAYIAMLKNTNVAYESVFNQTQGRAEGNTTATLDTALVAQYSAWVRHAYARKTWPLWVLALVAPQLLTFVPEPMRIPVALETSQLGVTCLALFVLCYVSAATQRSVFDFIAIQNALGNVYLMVGGLGTWSTIFCITFCMRHRNFIFMPAPMLVVCLAKSARLLDERDWREQTHEILVCAVIAVLVYVASVLSFCRAENVAVRQGWGSIEEARSDAGSDEGFDLQSHDTRFTVHDTPGVESPRRAAPVRVEPPVQQARCTPPPSEHTASEASSPRSASNIQTEH